MGQNKNNLRCVFRNNNCMIRYDSEQDKYELKFPNQSNYFSPLRPIAQELLKFSEKNVQTICEESPPTTPTE